MRSTLQTFNRDITTNLNRLTSELQRVNQQIGSGKKIDKPSDDPVAMVGILGLRSNLGAMQQYQENLNHGDNLVEASENALRQVNDLVGRARILAIQQINGTVGAANRASIASEVRNILEQTVILGNSRVGGQYIFGGHRTTGYTEQEPAPFMVDRIQGYRLNGTNPPVSDEAAPTPSPPLALGDLVINGLEIEATVADGISDIYADASAAAKANAINARAAETGVSAQVIPAYKQAVAGVETGAFSLLSAGDLVINGVDIFNLVGATAVVAGDTDNAVLNAINSQTAATGVVATRDSDGRLLLAAEDGRNLHITTTANGEEVTHLNDLPAVAQEKVYFGALQLYSDNRFIVETPLAAEAGLDAIGLAGGEAVSGEAGDLAGDGKIVVDDVARRTGAVRYTGDPDNDLQIRVGSSSTLTVGRNGKDALVDHDLFTSLAGLQDALLSRGYIEAVGENMAVNFTVPLAAGGTGLRLEDDFTAGTFTVTVTDQGYFPPQELEFKVGVDPANDTLQSMADKLNGIPGLEAAWSVEGFLEVKSSDPGRYSFGFSDDSSNFLEVVGIREEDMQVQAIETALGNLEQVFDKVAVEISDFGVRTNRIQSQRETMEGLELILTENMSDMEDTDMVEALLELKTKQTAYEAALNTAAKAMKISLVDFL